MSQRLIDIIRRSGDADMGAALVRMARLAAAVHQHEAARELHHADDTEGLSLNVADPQPLSEEAAR